MFKDVTETKYNPSDITIIIDFIIIYEYQKEFCWSWTFLCLALFKLRREISFWSMKTFRVFGWCESFKWIKKTFWHNQIRMRCWILNRFFEWYLKDIWTCKHEIMKKIKTIFFTCFFLLMFAVPNGMVWRLRLSLGSGF